MSRPAGIVVWFTGLPQSGKTALAARVRERLEASHGRCIVLDSDEVRDALAADRYEAADRDDFYRRLATLAALLARQGHVVLVSATAPGRAHRSIASAAAPHYIEVWVRTPLPECEARDQKGLYARARAGNAPTLPGLGVPYEAPLAPDVTADGGFDDAAAATIERLVLCHALVDA